MERDKSRGRGFSDQSLKLQKTKGRAFPEEGINMAKGLSNGESKEFTKSCLKEAALRLLKDASLEEVSITEICARAGVSRMAFYRNYGSREDFIEDLAKTYYETVFEIFNSPFRGKEPKEFYRRVFEWMKKNFDFIKGVYTADAFGFINRHCTGIKDPEERCRMLSYYSSIMAITSYWAENGMKESPDEMADICARVLKNV